MSMSVERNTNWIPWVLEKTGAQALQSSTLIQTLWGGYGELLRLTLKKGRVSQVVLKRIVPPILDHQSFSDLRKRRSYQVETNWYLQGAQHCDENSRVAKCYAGERVGSTWLLLLEDLESAGFSPQRQPGPEHTRSGLSWLAHFHSRFLNRPIPGLWDQGCYWHLETRRQEWEKMPCGPLKEHADSLDQKLKKARFQSLVHGDAKTPNFCWNSEKSAAAAVDFQYVGTGCGIRDVALFLDRCLGPEICDLSVEHWLDVYFDLLNQALIRDGHTVSGKDLEDDWRPLYPVAWADYCRFRQGWAGPSALSSYSLKQIERALE